MFPREGGGDQNQSKKRYILDEYIYQVDTNSLLDVLISNCQSVIVSTVHVFVISMYASITLEIKGKYFVNVYLTANYVISSCFFSLQNMWEYC